MHHTEKQRPILRRAPSVRSSDSTVESETQQICQGWSHLTSLHCVLLPEVIKPPESYAAPQIELLARRLVIDNLLNHNTKANEICLDGKILVLRLEKLRRPC